MKVFRKLFKFFLFVLFLGFPAFVFSEELLDNDFGYSLDVPEAFQVAEYTPDGMSYRFQHSFMPVSLLLKIYPAEVAKDVNEAFNRTMERLNGKADVDYVLWRNQNCIVSSFSMTLPGSRTEYSGWAEAVPLPGKDSTLVLLCYTETQNFQGCLQFIISTLNSLVIDRGSLSTPGIFTTYAFPGGQKESVDLKIENVPVRTTIDSSDLQALRFVIDMEFSVFTLYVKHEKWQEAWIRYYRTVWRESAGRLKKVSSDIYSALYPVCKRENPESPMIRMNELLLRWVQYMPYARDNKTITSADFSDLITVLTGGPSDCDSRSLLLSVLLDQMGESTCLFVSREYSHALYGVDFAIPGAKINVEGRNYLLCETTAKDIAPGLVAQDQSKTENWIPILPRVQ